MLRASAPSQVLDSDGRMRGDVLRAIRAGASSDEAHAGVLHGFCDWWGFGGVLAAALVVACVTLMQPLAQAPSVAEARSTLRLDAARTPRAMLAPVALAERPLEQEARRLKADLRRGINFLRSTVTLARSK